jgi:exosortase C (VPDSG-CTERM-specific)
MLAFSLPLWDLAQFASESDLYSYILLIPFISAYFIWEKWKQLPTVSAPDRLPAIGYALGALVALGGYAFARHQRTFLTEDEYLALMMTAFVLCFVGGCCWVLGRERIRALAFPIGLLVFLIPMPTALLDGVETFLQHGSAIAAAGFFHLAFADFARDGLVFALPTITIQVAPECSGIHSTLVLLITSVVAGQMFLRSPWKRTFLVLVVLPLALLRNGFRVFVLGELCTHVGPEMIDSPIHHRGGPIFFVLSLIPFFLLLLWLRKTDRKPPQS